MIIVGISGGLGHDPAACLVRDGALVIMAEEERFQRIKHAPDMFPLSAMVYCLQEAGIDLQDVDAIGIGWDPRLMDRGLNHKQLEQLYRQTLKHHEFHNADIPTFIPIEHHLAHAASSFYASGFEEAAIIVVDGTGEAVSTTLAYGKGQKIEILKSFDTSQSIGYFYEAITRYIGLGGYDAAGKTMGLAPYGQPVYSFPNIHLTPDGYHMEIRNGRDKDIVAQHRHITDQWMNWFSKSLGPPNNVALKFNRQQGMVGRTISIDERFKNVAASAQKIVEQLLIHLVDVLLRATGSRNLVLAGGVALNLPPTERSANRGLLITSIFSQLPMTQAARSVPPCK